MSQFASSRVGGHVGNDTKTVMKGACRNGTKCTHPKCIFNHELCRNFVKFGNCTYPNCKFVHETITSRATKIVAPLVVKDEVRADSPASISESTMRTFVSTLSTLSTLSIPSVESAGDVTRLVSPDTVSTITDSRSSSPATLISTPFNRDNDLSLPACLDISTLTDGNYDDSRCHNPVTSPNTWVRSVGKSEAFNRVDRWNRSDDHSTGDSSHKSAVARSYASRSTNSANDQYPVVTNTAKKISGENDQKVRIDMGLIRIKNARASMMLSKDDHMKTCKSIHNGIKTFARSNLSYVEKQAQFEIYIDNYTKGDYAALNRGMVLNALADNCYFEANVQMLEYILIVPEYKRLFKSDCIMTNPIVQFDWKPINLALWCGNNKFKIMNSYKDGDKITHFFNLMKRTIDVLLQLGYGFNVYKDSETFLGPLITLDENQHMWPVLRERLFDYILNDCKFIENRTIFGYSDGIDISYRNFSKFKFFFLYQVIKTHKEENGVMTNKIFEIILGYVYEQAINDGVYHLFEDRTKIKFIITPVLELLMKAGCSYYDLVEGKQEFIESEFLRFFKANSMFIDNIPQKFFTYFVDHVNKDIEDIMAVNGNSSRDVTKNVTTKLYVLGLFYKMERINIASRPTTRITRSSKSTVVRGFLKNIVDEIKSTINTFGNHVLLETSEFKMSVLHYLLYSTGINLANDLDLVDQDLINYTFTALSDTLFTLHPDRRVKLVKLLDNTIKINTGGVRSIIMRYDTDTKASGSNIHLDLVDCIVGGIISAPSSVVSAPISVVSTGSVFDEEIINRLSSLLDSYGCMPSNPSQLDTDVSEIIYYLGTKGKFSNDSKMALAIASAFTNCLPKQVDIVKHLISKFESGYPIMNDLPALEGIPGLKMGIKCLVTTNPEQWAEFVEVCPDLPSIIDLL